MTDPVVTETTEVVEQNEEIVSQAEEKDFSPNFEEGKDIDETLEEELDKYLTEEEEEEEQEEPQTEEEQEEPVGEVPTNHKAWAQLNYEKREANRELERVNGEFGSYKEIMEIMMKTGGYDDFNSFAEAIRDANNTRMAEETGLDKDTYLKQQEVVRREQQLQQREYAQYQQELQSRGHHVQGMISSLAKDNGIEEKDIFDELERAGYSDPVEFLSTPNLPWIIESAVGKLSSNKRVEERVSQELARPAMPGELPKGKQSTGGEAFDLDALVLESLKDL